MKRLFARHSECSEESQQRSAVAQGWKLSGEKARTVSAGSASSGFFVASLLRMTAVGLFASLLAGCKTVPPPKPIDQLTPQEHAGYVLFQQNCAQCHYDRDTGSLHGPSLLSVYKKEYLQSGAPANDERITWTIQHGRGMMPPLGGQVSQDDIASILAYLKTL